MTPQTLEAVVESGLLRPLEKLDLPEQKHVLVTISELARPSTSSAATCYELAKTAGLIGLIPDGPTDLSTNPDHFQGFGK